MAILLGGRAAERLVFGELSTGASDDLAKVTDIARSMVMQYGMEESLGNVVYERRPSFLGMPTGIPGQERAFSEETARIIDATVQRVTKAAFDKASGVLEARRKVLERGALLLLERETLTEIELTKIVEAEPMLPFPPQVHSASAPAN